MARKKDKIKVLVTGANGQLGQCIREIAPKLRYEFVFTDFEELDITSVGAVAEMMDAEKPDWVVNCAAYTAVDRAEEEKDIAGLLNVTAVGILAAESARVGAGIVHISTDYVFSGDQPTPRTEDDETEPVSVYGRTKLEGEKLVLQNNPKHIILRTSWLYSVYGNNFVKTMRRLGAERDEVQVVSDQWGSPTSAHDLARAVATVIEKPVYGVYHFSNQGATNWAIFAEEVMNLSGIGCVVKHITTQEYPTPAKRPEYSLLSKHKFTETFGVVIPEWEHSLEEVIARF